MSALTCASVSTRNRSASRWCWHAPRRIEHLHAGTHPKQIGLAQPLARDAHGDAPDELWLESMAYLWGEGRCSEHLHAGRPDELWLESMAYLWGERAP